MIVPDLFLKYGSAVGERGMAHVELALNGSNKTVISKLRTKAPLLVQKALYPDSSMPDMAHVYLMSSAGGILQGDRMDIKITAGHGTLSRITTQAATKIYKMDKGYATQDIAIATEDASYLEFIPYQLIPFKSSRFCQNVSVQAAQGSTVVYSEIVSAGRTASGEAFDFDVCFLKMNVHDKTGKLLFSDAACIEPESSKDFERLFGGKTLWSMIYVVTPDHERIDQQVNVAIKEHSVLAGCSTLPHDCGLVVRMLDDSIDKIRHLTESISGIAKSHALAAARP
jgi:urease accessory protein